MMSFALNPLWKLRARNCISLMRAAVEKSIEIFRLSGKRDKEG